MRTEKGSAYGSNGGIMAPIDKELVLLEDELERIFSSEIDLISVIGQHLITVKGKRVRPAMVLLTSKLGEPDSAVAVRVAAAVEIIHTATLLHDDSLDRSHLRRGMPTVNSLWNDQVSVIMGDHLFCTAFRLLHEAELFKIASVLSKGSDSLTFGEMFQMDLRGRYDISEETYLSMIRHKTASLFASACEAGAIVGGLSENERAKLSQYGECLGIAFQMIDDVLDLVGDVTIMGKPVGNDLRDERITLPVIVALRDAGQREAARIREIVASRDLLDHSWDEIVGLIERNGGVTYARRKAQDLAGSAKSYIADFRPCAAKQSLMQLADVVVARKK